MGTRIRYIADRLRNSYWFVPTVMLLLTTGLAWATINIDEHTDPERVRWLGAFVYSGGPDGAREVLGTIAASMITVAGVVFSIAIVTLQLASSQFGPRMLANFVRDRGHQVTLGTFVSAFLYSLLVLRVVRTDSPGRVPHLSVTVAVILAVAGLSVLIYFVHHVATTIQAPRLVESIAVELRHATDVMFPDEDEIEHGHAVASQEPPDDAAAGGRPVMSHGTGYVQVIDLDHIVDLAREHDLVVRLETRPGRFVVQNTPFARVHSPAGVPDDVLDGVAAALTTGARRTAQQDVEFPIRQLVEIAVRSLSPGINDPFTASTCVDQLGAALCTIAARELPSPYVVDDEGSLRLVHGDPLTWKLLLGSAFDQIRQCADFHTPVYVHLLQSLARVAGCVRDRSRLDPLVVEARLVVEAAGRKIEAEADLEVVEQRYDELVGVVEAVRASA